MREKFVCVILFLLIPVTGGLSCAADGPQATIIRDNYGVPHIYADTLQGLYFGFGYAAAQDRLYQMEMFRRTFWGRLSEIYGDKLLAFDQSNRRDNLTFSEVRRQVESLEPDLQSALNSFAEGINAYITEALADRSRLPREFHEFGFDPEPWTVEDVSADFLSVMGFFMDASAELLNATMFSYLTEHYGKDKGAAMFQDWCWVLDPASPTTIRPGEREDEGSGRAASPECQEYPAAALPNAGKAQTSVADERLGSLDTKSNAYVYGRPTSYALVLSPQKSASGKAVLMGGPQFGFQLPSALYEVGLHGAGIDAVGSSLAGYPFIMFGHNKKAAFSSTAGMDNIEDVFAEKLNPENPRQYWYKGSWRNMEVRVETFKVRGQPAEVSKEFSFTVHGPVFYADEAHHVAFSKRLSCKDDFLEGLASFYDLMQAETVPAFEKAARRSSMSINYFFANADGDIAYYHLGKHPIRAEGVDLRLPTPGTGEFEWRGYLPKEKNPHIVNPAGGYIANWNNQPAPGWGHGDMATTDLWGGWGADSRATSLDRPVAAKPTLTREDVKDIIKNIAFYDKRATNIKALLIEAVAKVTPKSTQAEEALRVLEQWNNLNLDENGDGYYDQPGSTIFGRWWVKAVAATFGDEFDGYKNPLGQSAVDILTQRYSGYTLFLKALKSATAVDYFNGQKEQVLYKALEDALGELAVENPGKTPAEYRTKTVMDIYHPITVLGYFLHQPITSSVGNLPPFSAVDRGTENHLVTLSPESIEAENITSPGDSGFIGENNTNSPYLDDQAEMFVKFTYKPMLFSEAEVKAAAASTQVVQKKVIDTVVIIEGR